MVGDLLSCTCGYPIHDHGTDTGHAETCQCHAQAMVARASRPRRDRPCSRFDHEFVQETRAVHDPHGVNPNRPHVAVVDDWCTTCGWSWREVEAHAAAVELMATFGGES
jgi:hypothetical protein